MKECRWLKPVLVGQFEFVEWTPARALALNALVLGLTVSASARLRREAIARKDIKRTRYDLPLRAAAAALVVAIVTTASHRIGSFASGTFAVFPIVIGTFVVILHAKAGGKAAGAVLAHAQPPLIGLCLGFLSFTISQNLWACGGRMRWDLRSPWRSAACCGGCAVRGRAEGGSQSARSGDCRNDLGHSY